jgi:stage III sporulation protein AB
MRKVLGSLLVLSGGALTWRLRRTERGDQRDTLADLLRVLRQMEAEIRMVRPPLPPLLESLSRDCGGAVAAFLHAMAQTAAAGGDLTGDWAAGAAALMLAPGDEAALADLGKSLRGDEENICKAIELVILRLEKSADELEKKRPEEEKRTAALCFSAAALLVILLI